MRVFHYQTMKHSNSDVWFVRLPDARILRAHSTRAVRHHIETGAIPPASAARRSPRDNWIPLLYLDAFADLARDHANNDRGGRGRSDGALSAANMQLQAVGVAGLLQELGAALDSTLHRRKLVFACAAGVVLALLLIVHEILLGQLLYPWSLVWLLAAGLLALLVISACMVVLGQMTFVELSQLRRSNWREALQNLPVLAIRLATCLLVAWCMLGGLLYVSFMLSVWLAEAGVHDLEFGEIIATLGTVLQILIQLALWPMLAFTLLLGPVVVVEEAPFWRSLLRWLDMVRSHLPRLFLYESLAIFVALIATLPLALPVILAATTIPTQGLPGLVARDTIVLLLGLAATPGLAYLTVANIFIYLHLRYELPPVR